MPGTPSPPDDLLAVGVITATHGIGGELKVKSFSGEPDHLIPLREAFFRKGGVEKRLRLESVRAQPPGVIVRVAGIGSPDTARGLVGFEIWVARKHAVKLAHGEYYTADLCRCALWFEDRRIGEVNSVLDTGSAQLLEIRNGEGRTFLVPFTDHFIGEVNLEGGRISLREDEIVR